MIWIEYTVEFDDGQKRMELMKKYGLQLTMPGIQSGIMSKTHESGT